MNNIEKKVNAIEKKDNGLVETIYHVDRFKTSMKEGISDSFEVGILKRLSGAIDLYRNAEDVVTGEYILKHLNLTEIEKYQVNESLAFELDKFPVMDIPRKIVEWERADNLSNHHFSGKDKQITLIRARSLIEIDPTRGMVRILPMTQWGEEGGVYAIKLLLDTEKRTEIKLVLKYDREGTYKYSEFITVKPSELTYGYEGVEELMRRSSKLKTLMDYSPAEKEPLDYRKLYLALSYFNQKITVRAINSDKLSFEAMYELIVSKVYNLGSAGVGEDIFGDGCYILTKEELESVAKEAGYTLKELIILLKERDLLETDKDKKSRNQKTTTRNGIKSKYYCVLTSERFNKLYEEKADMLSVSEEDFKEYEEFCETILGNSGLGLECKKKKHSKKALIAW